MVVLGATWNHDGETVSGAHPIPDSVFSPNVVHACLTQQMFSQNTKRPQRYDEARETFGDDVDHK